MDTIWWLPMRTLCSSSFAKHVRRMQLIGKAPTLALVNSAPAQVIRIAPTPEGMRPHLKMEKKQINI
jgi:hypothetical protein